MGKVLKAGLILGFLITLAGTSPVQATLTLSLDDGLGNSVSVGDGTTQDANPAAGVITYLGPLGSWIVNVTTGVGSPPLAPGRMDLNSINLSSASSGTLHIAFTQTDFIGPDSLIAEIGGTAGGSITYRTYANGTEITSQSFGAGAFSGSASGLISETAYSITQDIVITHGAGPVSSSFNATVVVPEPTTILAGALLLLPFGACSVRLLRKR
ncbi:MAG: hypothetical protein AB9869_13935 [Verrucomicrobiia bacterium]